METAAYFLQLQWYDARPLQGGGTPDLPALGVALDFLFVAWLLFPMLSVAATITAAIVTWRSFVRCRQRAAPLYRVVMLGIGAIAATAGALFVVCRYAPSFAGALLRPGLCITSTYEEAVSPNGRYRASVIQIDCGAMSSFNRQVVLTRLPLTGFGETLLFFNQQPAIHLGWTGRMLTVQGEEAPESMPHPPPDPIVWGGVMVRYTLSSQR